MYWRYGRRRRQKRHLRNHASTHNHDNFPIFQSRCPTWILIGPSNVVYSRIECHMKNLPKQNIFQGALWKSQVSHLSNDKVHLWTLRFLTFTDSVDGGWFSNLTQRVKSFDRFGPLTMKCNKWRVAISGRKKRGRGKNQFCLLYIWITRNKT